MTDKNKMEITVGSLPDKENLVVEFWNEKKQWGELSQENGVLTIEIYPPKDSSCWAFQFDEVLETLKKGKQKLIENCDDGQERSSP